MDEPKKSLAESIALIEVWHHDLPVSSGKSLYLRQSGFFYVFVDLAFIGTFASTDAIDTTGRSAFQPNAAAQMRVSDVQTC